MAVVTRAAGSVWRFPGQVFRYRAEPRFRTNSSSSLSERRNVDCLNLSSRQSALPAFAVESLRFSNLSSLIPTAVNSGEHVQLLRSLAIKRVVEQELNASPKSNVAFLGEPSSVAPAERKNSLPTHFDVAIPISERATSSVAALVDVLQWRQQAQDLACTVGSKFADADGGPEVIDLLRELEWFLDDAVAGCGGFTGDLNVQSCSRKLRSWREIKDSLDLKIENIRCRVGRLDNGLESLGEIASGAFADLSKDRHCDPVSEFATDCGCSCDGIREHLIESGPSVSSTSRLESANISNSFFSDSNDERSLQVFLRMSLAEMDKAWKGRILERKPFQYVVSAAHWRDLVLAVMEGVLIPRPETEQLIDLAEHAITKDGSLAEGLWIDLGTGSGAIAISLARLLGRSGSVLAVDASSTAVAVATRNVERYCVQDKVQVVQGLWFSALNVRHGEVAGIVSNPPYIPTNDLEKLQTEVGKHEPRIALDGGPDGAADLRTICNGSVAALRSGGFLALETNGGCQAEDVQDYLRGMRVLDNEGNSVNCFQDVKCVKDFSGVCRFVIASRL